MNTNQPNLTQADADALELAYPMHGDLVRDLLSHEERLALAAAEAEHQAWLMGEVVA